MLPSSFADICAMDIVSFLSQAYFAGKPEWSPDQMSDQTGRVAVITGGNSGVGVEIARELLRHNAKVYLACRSQTKAQRAIEDLRQATGKTALFLRLDLADLGAVKTAAEDFLGYVRQDSGNLVSTLTEASKEEQLHLLYNNGGVMFCPMDKHAKGYDLQIHTNVLGHFYFTKLLLPLLLSTGTRPGVHPRTVRVINITSSAHYLARSPPLNFGSFKCGPIRNRHTTEDMYVQSKIANAIFSCELARRYGSHGLVSLSVNPGNLSTSLGRHTTNPLKRLVLLCLQIYPPSWGAITPLWAGTSEGASLNGKFLIPWARIGKPRMEVEDPQLGSELWMWLEEQVSLHETIAVDNIERMAPR